MIKINASHIDWEEIKNEHYEHMKEKFKEWLKANKESDSFKGVRDYLWDYNDRLREERVEHILVGDIGKLREIIEVIGEVKNADTVSKSPYDHITQSNNASSYGYRYLKKIKVDVCPYCNMQYTFTIEKAKRRPQFDHFFPKGKYSYLQASLFNLIPSCQPCNLSKGEKVPWENGRIYYPYGDGMGEDVYFQTKIKEDMSNIDFSHWLGFKGDFEVELVANTGEKGRSYMEGMQGFFKLQDLYKEHHNNYVRDIIKNLIIYDASRIQELQQSFSDLFETKEDVLDVVLMNRIQINDWGKRPLAKLTHDIYQEFKEEQ